MPGINSSSIFNVSTFSGINTDLAIKPNSKASQEIKLEFEADKLGFPNPYKRPSELRLTDQQIERQTLKQIGLDVSSSENLALVNKRLKTDNPFEALHTSGSNLAAYNADTGKYQIKIKIDGNLYAKLKGWAESAQAEIAATNRDKTNRTAQTDAPQAVTNDRGAQPTIKVFVPLVKAEADQSLADSALLSYVSDRYGYEKSGLFGENIVNIRNEAKNAGVKAIKAETVAVGNKQWVRVEISRSDGKNIEDIFKAERAEVTRQTNVVDGTTRDTVANKFAEGFLRGAWQDLKSNAEMIYGAARDPLGTMWKVGEAIVQIPLLPTRIGIGIGQAAIELAKLTPEQRQGLVNELIKKGYTDLRDLPVAEAAERAGEIVGTMAMEAVLAKGAGLGLKGLSALKGTAFLSKIETLAQTAKVVIAEVKVPVKVTSEVLADTAGGTQKIFNVEKKPLGELMQTMESRAKEILSGGTENASRVKSIGLPSWNKLTIRLEADGVPHLINNHKVDGKGYLQSSKDGGKKDVFPAWMSEKQIMSAVREAYGNSKKMGTQIDFETGAKKTVLLGESNGMKIKMYVNLDTKELETAFPQWR